jgi:hypothetical protein
MDCVRLEDDLDCRVTTLSATVGSRAAALHRPARLRDVNPRPRPAGSAAQLGGELCETVAQPAGDDVVDGDPIDARRSAVGTDLAPGPPEHVAAGDFVVEGMEGALLILLSAAAEHALESARSDWPPINPEEQLIFVLRPLAFTDCT